ncbi:hypothetical protein BI335_14225 [Enemella evansiae]|uniref:GNAT family N-acetyltransferase n=1 Tax=Enemella evansiae TaxID=2016499 RepID=UPI000B97AD29|nr:hypothetical protein [Enemella evansiae]OYO12368.1 hypothetical protein BI335_14225 [Enemella evansiae]
MNALDMLRLEAETIWGTESRGRLAAPTVEVLLSTYDGRSATMPGAAALGSDDAVHVTMARGWLLGPGEPGRPPEGYRLVTDAQSGTLARPSGWAEADWEQLVSGGLGPWAVVLQGEQVVSLAHAARLTERAAEVGVQTEAAHRGLGLAGFAVRTWASLFTDERVLFYSAFEENLPSHRVAAQVGARPLGRLTRLFLAPGAEPS